MDLRDPGEGGYVWEVEVGEAHVFDFGSRFQCIVLFCCRGWKWLSDEVIGELRPGHVISN